jgi:hypothetical protein
MIILSLIFILNLSILKCCKISTSHENQLEKIFLDLKQKREKKLNIKNVNNNYFIIKLNKNIFEYYSLETKQNLNYEKKTIEDLIFKFNYEIIFKKLLDAAIDEFQDTLDTGFFYSLAIERKEKELAIVSLMTIFPEKDRILMNHFASFPTNEYFGSILIYNLIKNFNYSIPFEFGANSDEARKFYLKFGFDETKKQSYSFSTNKTKLFNIFENYFKLNC